MSLVSSSVSALPPTVTYTIGTAHKAGQTQATGIDIGTLEQKSSILTVNDLSGTTDTPQSYDFTIADDDTLFLEEAFSNIIDQLSTRIQLYDTDGVTIIADNQGDAGQQLAFQQLTEGGLTPGAGTYRLTVTTIGGEGAPAFSIGLGKQYGVSLGVASQLTAAVPNEYYNFDLEKGNNIKLDYDITQNSNLLRVQLLDVNGAVVADSRGSAYEQLKFAELTSGVGLTATPGSYSIKISYAPGASLDESPRYNFSLYSGSTYAVVYQNNVTAPPGDNSADGSVTATDDAQLFARTDFHSIKNTALTGVNIGWIMQDKSRLSVFSRITTFNSTEFYKFTLQTGNNLKLGFANTTGTTDLRVQLLDSTGSKVIADNFGTDAQKAAYKSLTSTTGIDAKTGDYVIKVSYATNAARKQQDYSFRVYSGTSFASSYQTTVSAQTAQNAQLSGDLGTAYSAAGATAAYINSLANGETTDIFEAISSLQV